MLAKETVAKVFTPGTHGSTFGGNPLAAAAAMAIAKRLTPSFLKGVKKKGASLIKKLVALKGNTSQIKAVRGLGLIIAIDIDSPALAIIEKAQQSGLLLSKTSDVTLRLTPPFTVNDKQIDQAVSILAKVLNVKA